MNLEYLAPSRSMSDFVGFTFEIKGWGGICQVKLGAECGNHTREQQPFHANNPPTAGIMRNIRMNSEQIQIKTLSCLLLGKY